MIIINQYFPVTKVQADPKKQKSFWVSWQPKYAYKI